MAIHKPYDRAIVVPANAKAATVGSLLLTEGQIGIYDLWDTDKDGAKPVLSFEGRRPDEKRYEIRVGRNLRPETRSQGDKNFSSPVFSINEIMEIRASAPKSAMMHVDDVILGYNGIDPETSINLMKGNRILINLTLQGKQLEILGYEGGKTQIQQYIYAEPCCSIPNPCIDCDPCDCVDCVEPTKKAIEALKAQPMAGGSKVEDFVDITLIHECEPTATPPTETDVFFYKIDVCDTGDGLALSELQAQYPGLKIERVARVKSTSTYKVVSEGPIPEDYEQKLTSIMKGCADCPTGYTEVKGGVIYAVTLEDEGEDKKAVVEGLPNAVTGTGEKMPGQKDGVGLYVVALTKKLTADEVKAFITANPTATVAYLTTTKAMCDNPTIETISWVEDGSCKASTQDYYIILPDGECGVSRLEELKGVYPELTITDYADIEPGGCQRAYKTTVKTNIVCDECDDVFKDYYRSEAPAPYENRIWKKIEVEADAPSTCKCGIRFRGKEFLLDPGTCYMDELAYTEDSIRISVSAGYPDEIREAIDVFYDPIHTEYLDRYAPRTHVGGNLVKDEDMGFTYFNGFGKHHGEKGRIARAFLNEDTHLELSTQYADFVIDMRPVRTSNGFGQYEYSHESFHLYVPYGAHQGIEDMVNTLAAAAGIKPAKV